MKKIFTGVTLILLALVTLVPIAKAQKVPFTGTVVYDLTIIGDAPPQLKSMMPTEMTLKATPVKLIQVMHSSMMDIKTIFDAQTKISNTLMGMMGQKTNIKHTAAEIADLRKTAGIEITVNSTTDTKTIAGHLCKRAIVYYKTNQTPEQTLDLFFTDDFDISQFSFGNTFPGVSGLQLEFTMSQGPYSFKATDKSVKVEIIPDSEFDIPADYKEAASTISGGGGQ